VGHRLDPRLRGRQPTNRRSSRSSGLTA
jgi:hypothetical protein